MSAICEYCSAQTKIFQRSGRVKRFCDDVCGGRFKSAKISRALREKRAGEFSNCKTCAARFNPGHGSKIYCSDYCRESCRNKGKRVVDCGFCRRPFQSAQPGATYCSRSCSTKATGVGSHHKRARKYGVAYEPINRARVFERDGWRCQICGKPTPRELSGTHRKNAPELDHRTPISLGGPHTYDNVQCACRACNMAKSNRQAIGQAPLFSNPGAFHG